MVKKETPHRDFILGPAPLPRSEALTNEERLKRKRDYNTPHNVRDRVDYEQTINRLRIYKVKRSTLGVGTAQVEPFQEVSLPYSILASQLCMKVVSMVEPEAIELLPENPPTGQVVARERVFVYKYTPMSQDFNIPKGRYVRMRLKQRRMLML